MIQILRTTQRKHTRIPHTSLGFSLVELLVVTILMGFILPIIATILITMIRQQMYIARFAEVKRQGDLVASNIKSKMGTEPILLCNNANVILPIPTNLGIPVTVYKVSKGTCDSPPHAIYTVANNVLSQNAVALTDAKVVVTTAPVITAIRQSATSHILVDVTFTITAKGVVSPTSAENIPSLTYSTKILVKE